MGVGGFSACESAGRAARSLGAECVLVPVSPCEDRLLRHGGVSQVYVDGEVLDAVASQPGVEEVHHLHVWALSTTENAMTAHIAVRDLQQMPQLKSALRARLHELGIDHATFEFEETGQPCSEHACCNLEAGSAAVKSPK